MYKQTSNLILRLVAQGLRFAFLLFVVRYLSTEDYVEFGVMYALIASATLACGFELHVSFNRDVARKKRLIRFEIWEQLLCISPFFVITTIMLGMYVFHAGREFPVLLIALLFTEYFSQECSRLLISMQMQIHASLNILVRTGAWTPLSLFLLYQSDSPSLLHVYLPWLFASLLSLVFGVVILINMAQFSSTQQQVAFKTLCKAKLKSSWRYFVMAIAMQTANSIDKLIAQELLPQNQLASYIFFTTLSSSISSIYIPFIQNIYQPKLVNCWGANNYNDEVKRYILGSIVTIAVSVVVLISIYPAIISIVEKDFLSGFYSVFLFTLVVSVIKTFSNVPHTIAFSKSLDGVIWKSTVTAFIGLFFFWIIAIFVKSEIIFYLGLLQFHVTIFALKWGLQK